MKRNIYKSVILLWVFMCSLMGEVVAQTLSTVGTDFHVMFLRNDKKFALSNSLSYYPDNLQLIMTGKNACTGTVTCTNGYFSADFTVTPGQITTVNIPKNTSQTNPVGKQAGYTMSSGYVENRDLHVTSSDSISLYAVNYCDASFDITNVLPTSALSDEYIIQNYKGINVGGNYRPAEFVVIATEDNTIVDITTTAKTGIYMPGTSPSTANTYNAGQTFSVTLNAGQTYQLLAWSVDPFDGTYVKARDCKKIAVFQGCGITPVPLSSYGYEDHLYEQSIPTKYWGKHFIVTQSLQRANDRVKVTALNDGCTVTVNGTLMKTLAARETYEFEVVKDLAADTLQNISIDKVYGTAHYIETSEPASVFLYLTSREYSNNTEKIGDPSMVLVTPVEQQIDYITFSTFETARVTMHHVNIVTETDKVSSMTLDGTSIADEFSQVPGNPDFSFARIDLEHGAHTMQCPGGGFAAHVYGFGQTAGKDESYAYTVGTGVKDLNKQLFVNGTDVDDISGYFESCNDEDINFEVVTTLPATEIEWIYGDNSSGSGNTTTHAYANEGIIELMAVIHWQEVECEIETDTLRAYLQINQCTVSDSTLYDTICQHQLPYTWDGLEFTEEGTLDVTIPVGDNDSIVHHVLTVKPDIDTTLYDTICASQLPYTWKELEFTEAGTQDSIVPASNGCDSTLHLVLTVKPDIDTTLYDTICANQLPYTWKEIVFTEAGTQDSIVPAYNGCDSTIHLVLTINPTYEGITDSRIICYDELPYEWDNVTFTDEGTLTDTLQTMNGCDSIVTKTISLYPHYNTSETREFCRSNVGYSNFTNTPNIVYIWDMFNPAATLMTGVMPLNDSVDFVLTQELTYADVNGCDSIATHNVIIHPSYNFQETLNLCDSELPYTWHGVDITPSMAHVQINIFGHTVASGCDSTYSASVILKQTSATGFFEEACDSFTWNDTIYTETGVYEQHFINSQNCDSTVTMHLTILRNDITIDSSVCESLTWNGQVYDTPGPHTQTFTNQYHCDSVVTINLTILNKTNDIYVTECDQYDWNGTIYDHSGEFVQHFTSSVNCDSAVTMHLTINPIYHEAETRETCDNLLPYTWAPGVIISEESTSEHNFQSVDHCDSIVTMTLIVNPTFNTSDEKTICSSQLPYEWNGVTFTEATNDVATLQSEHGCDSVVGMTLHVNPSYNDITETRTICDDELPYTWNAAEGIIFNEAATQTHTLTSSLNCDSTVAMTLVVNPTYDVTDFDTICDNQLPFTWNGVTFNEAGTQPTTLQSINHCDSVVTMTLTVNPTYIVTTDSTICQSELPFTWNGVTFNDATTLTAHLLTIHNCDSSVIMTLNVNPTYNTTDTRIICDKELPYNWDGMIFDEAGTQTDHMTTIDGCDSIVTKTLIVNPTYNIDETRQACDDELPYTWNAEYNIIFNNAGTQTHTLQSAHGCDSTVTMTLVVNPTHHVTDLDTICDDLLPFVWNGVTFTEAGTQDATLQTVNQCDSLVTMTLVVNPTYDESDEKTICSSQLPYEWNGVTFTEASEGIATLQSVNGCDSVVGMTLHVNPSYNDITETRTICDDEMPYTWNATEGIIFNVAGTQTHTLTSSLNCDSTVAMTLIVNPTYHVTDFDTICDNQLPFTWNGVTFNEAGTQATTLQTINHCDSVVTMTLTVNPTYIVEDSKTICATLLPYTWNGVTFNGAGTQTGHLLTIHNCDSSVIMTLNVNPIFDETDTRIICDNELPYNWDGLIFDEAGTQTDHMTTIDGCDSIVTKTLIVNPTHITAETRTICDSELPYTWNSANNIVFNEAGTQTHTIPSSLNCDSTVTMTLVVNPTFHVTDLDTICDDLLPYIWNGVTFTEAGIQDATLQTVNHCDSVVTMTLVVNSTYDETDEKTICSNELPYEWNGVTFTEASEDIATLQSVNGCDSVVGMTLHVNPSYNDITETRTICDNELPYTWNEANNIVFTEAGTQTHTISSSLNCDSTVTMTLVVNPTYHVTDFDTICDNQLPFTWNGVTFNEAGTQDATLQTINHCDSVVTMTLTVNPTYIVEDSKTICATLLPYTWNGVTFNEAGTQTGHLLTINNCDSSVIMTLNVNPIFDETDTRTICDNELPYNWDGLIFDEAGTQTDHMTTIDGCDSIVTKTLIVNPTHITAETRTICDSELPYTWNAANNIVFTEAGTQTHTIPSSLNCDSTVTMTLVVNPTFHVTDLDTICDDLLPYIWNGVTFTEAGIQDATLQTVNHCDSVVTMTLVVNPTYDETDEKTICSNELPYEWNGVTFNEAGIQATTLQSIHGCDSVVGMTLHVNPSYNDITETRTICDNELPYTWNETNNIVFTEAGTQTHTISSSLNCDSTVTMTLVVNPTYEVSDSENICDSELPYTWHETEFTEAVTEQVVTFQTTEHCDSTFILTLVVNPTYTYTEDTTICASELPFTWHETVFTEADSQTITFQTTDNCDSTYNMTLHINPIYEVEDTVTICYSQLPYTWDELVFTEAGTQVDPLHTINNCDSIVTKTLVVNATFTYTETDSICDSELPYTWHEHLFTEAATEEVVTFQTDNHCDSTFILTLVVNPTYDESDSRTICASELPYEWNGVTFTEAINTVVTLQSQYGCDSTVGMTLIVNPIYNIEDTVTICDSELPYTWDEIVFTEAGTIVDTLPTIENCDSTVTKTLVVNPTYAFIETDTICDSELPYTWHETVFTEAGTQTASFQSQFSCDSIHTMTLYVMPTYHYDEDTTICASELPLTWHEYTFTGAGSADTTFLSQYLCDSSYSMTLHVNPIYDSIAETRVICDDLLPYHWDNDTIVFTEAGTQTHTLASSLNCDSTVYMTLIVNPTYAFTETDTVCDSELPYTWHETVFNEAGTQTASFQSQFSCDSIHTMTLYVMPTYHYDEDTTICASELPYIWHEYTFTGAGSADTTFLSQYLCDSSYSMTLHVNPIYDSIAETRVICDDLLPYYWDNDTIVFTEAGTQTHTLASSLNCDSTVYMTLIVNPTYAFTETDTVCDSELPYTWHETVFTEAGTQTASFQSQFSCDSIHTMTLYVMPTYHYDEDTTICASELPLTWHEIVFEEAGSADTTFYSQYLCDSSYSMTLHVNPIYDSIAETRVICDDLLPYHWDNDSIVFTEAGTQTHTLASSLNCDSTVYMTLIVNPTYAFTETDTVCDSELPYTWHETVFTEAGTQTASFLSEFSCDSTYTMTLFVMPTYHYDEDTTICASELPLTWHEIVFEEAGSADTTFFSQYLCDSSYSMTLHVNPIYDLEDSRTICDDALPYTWDGVTFTEAGTLIDTTLTTTEGCDSIVTKHLTVNPTKTFEFDAEVCDQYTWNEQTYTLTGDYNQSFLTTLGCDSTVTLHLIVNYSTEYEFDTIACEEFVWNGTSYFESGDYTQNLNTIHSCDSIVTAHLTIGHHTPAEIFIDTCDSYTIGDVVYTDSGVFNQTISTVLGCDSLITLHLNLDYTPDANIIGDHFPIGGSETYISKYHYYVTPIHDVVVIDSVEWFINCPNWYTAPIGNGEHTDLYIHTFLPNDSVELVATVYSNCGSATQSIWLHTSYFGTEENDAQNSNVEIMPNPNNGDMNIRFENINGNAEIKVFDLLGNIIDHFKVTIYDDVMIMPYSLKTKAEASYYFLITTDKTTFSRKVIVHRQ